jgi:hypothetical protein
MSKRANALSLTDLVDSPDNGFDDFSYREDQDIGRSTNGYDASSRASARTGRLRQHHLRAGRFRSGDRRNFTATPDTVARATLRPDCGDTGVARRAAQ